MATAPPTPGIEAGHVLARGFEALKANFPLFFAAALLLVGLHGFLGQYLTFSRVASGSRLLLTGDFWTMAAAFGLVALLGNFLLLGILTRSTILHLGGREPDLPGSLALALRLLLPLVGLSFCVGFLVALGFLCLIVPGIMAYCAFIVAVPVLIEERGGVFDAIGRSRALTRGSRFQIFLIVVLVWIFSTVVSGLFGVITGATMWGAAAMPDPLLAGAANGLSTSLTAMLSATLIAALYVELREVKEGAGAHALAQVFG